MRVTICSIALAAVVSMTSTASALPFSEDWDDGLGATRWSAPIIAQEDPGIPFDGSVDYAFDYSVLGAGPAPNTPGVTTIGVAMETNTTDQCPADPNCTDSDEGEGVGIVPLSALATMPAGDFLLQADMYIYWNGGSGSTEYGTFGAFSGGTASPIRFNIDHGDGLAWQVDGEDGSSTDILRYESLPIPGSETGLGSYDAIPNGSIPSVPTGGALGSGPFNQWVEMDIYSVSGIVSFSMNGFVIDTFDNTGGTFSGGTLLLGHSDPFNSVNPDDPISGLSNVVVFDNISLTVPEPSSFVLLGMASLGVIGLVRRRV